MPNVNVSFAGQTLILPGSYYQDQLAGFVSAPPTTPPLIFIGYGYGVPPQTPFTFVNGAQLLSAIRGGPCSGFVPFLYSPSPQLFGAQLVTYINVGQNTQASLVVANGGGTPLGTFTTTNYGVPSNLMQLQVTTGSLAGKKLTLYDGYAGTTIVGDNLGVPFQVAYTGNSVSGATLIIATSGLNATSLTLSGSVAGQTFSAPLGGAGYPTIAQVVEFINGTGFYSAITIGDGNMPSQYLDSGQGAVSLTVSGSGGYSYTNVTAALGSVLYWTNQYAQSANYATFALSGTISQFTSGLAPANAPFTSFSGATSVPPTNTQYASALNLALTIPGWAVFCDSNSTAVQALGTQHALTASQPVNGSWRRFYTGSTVGDSVNTTIVNAQNNNSNRSIYVYPGIYATNTITGVNTLYGGLYAAAAAAGMDSGNIIAMPLTNKVLSGNGVEVSLTTAQINQLQQAGVMCLKGTTPPTSGTVNYNNIPPTIVSDLTCWQNDNNPENVFDQQIKCRDYLAYSIVNATEPYVGTIADVYDETRILNAVKATLNALIYTPGSNGVLASWNPQSLTLVYNGNTQTAAVCASVQLVGQNRFITETITIFPLQLTITAANLTPAS